MAKQFTVTLGDGKKVEVKIQDEGVFTSERVLYVRSGLLGWDKVGPISSEEEVVGRVQAYFDKK